MHGYTVHGLKVNLCGWEKKKAKTRIAAHVDPNPSLVEYQIPPSPPPPPKKKENKKKKKIKKERE